MVVALVVFLGVGAVGRVMAYWAQVPARQLAVLRAAQLDLRSIPSGSTVILDGVCPYHGPAIVFETYWDVGGALSLALRRKITGEAVSPRLSLTPAGLQTSIYGEAASYRYGPTLYAYNPNLRMVAPLADEAAAHRYFSRLDRWRAPCPASYVGHGVLI